MLAPGRELRRLPGGILSALEADGTGAPYDRKAAAYDRLIPSRLYNRLVWSTHPDDYRRFAERADALDLPFAPAGFGSVAAMGALHLFDGLARLLTSLEAQLVPGGSVHLSGLVAATRRGSAYMRALKRAGEIARIRTEPELRAELEAGLGVPVGTERSGSMVYAVATVA